MHEVESMAYVGEVPWHGLGTEITKDEDATNPDKFLVAAGLDWEVETIPVVTEDLKQETTHFATRRTTDNKILGVVGGRYRPLQNKDAFNWFTPFLETGDVKFEAGGSLRGGAVIWALAKVDAQEEVRRNDTIQSYILLSHGHDGLHCVKAGFTPIRVVCMNTLRMAKSHVDTKLIKLRHTASLENNLKNIGEIMNLAVGEFHATVEQYKLLADKGINQKDVEKYVKKVFDITADEEDEEKIATKTLNKIAKITDLTFNGRGNTGKTYWDAYNGVTEYLSHEAGRNNDTRLHSLWFGDNGKLNKKALDIGTELAMAA